MHLRQRVWFAGPDPALPGGVTAALDALLPELPEAERVVVGRRPGRPWAAVGDPWRLGGGGGVLVQNPSLRPRALARDLAVLAAWRGPAAWWLHGGSDAAWAALSPALVRALSRRITLVVLAERYGARWIRLGGAPDRVRVIPPPYDPRAVPDPGARGRDVVFLGRLTAAKGPDRLLEAFAAWVGASPDAARGSRLILAGDGPLRAALAARARDLGVAHRVVLPGFLEGASKRAALAGAAVVALPSRDEAVPVALIEALASGVPVVAGHVGAVAETIAGAGRVVAPDDVAALARAIGALVAEGGARAPRARALAARHHPARVAAAWRALLAELA